MRLDGKKKYPIYKISLVNFYSEVKACVLSPPQGDIKDVKGTHEYYRLIIETCT